MLRTAPREYVKQGIALAVLLVLAGFAIAGPTGLLAWNEQEQALKQHEARILSLTEERDALKNRVELLDPDAADPDLASELVRRDLGVMHADEVVITLPE
ncbi:MAG: septum formation initiator family protein [Pseudomonadota bacterium]